MADSKDELKRRIEIEEDFVFAPKHEFSLKKLLAAKENKHGLKDQQIAKALMMTVEEVEEEFQMAVEKIKKALNL